MTQKKKRKKHGKSILQPKEDKRCFLCMLLHDDYREQYVEDHHVIYGYANRRISEELGLKVNLCLAHHKYGPEAVHKNHEIDVLLKDVAQRRFEELYSHEEWWKKFNQNFYTEDSIWDIYKKNMG